MAKKDLTPKVTLEREYIIPLRRKVEKVPKYKRAKKAITEIRNFIARHMKVEDREVRKVKIDKWLNNEVWFRGIKKPPIRIKVRAKKYDNGEVRVELSEIPKIVQFKIDSINKKKELTKTTKKAEEKPVETTESKEGTEEKEETTEETTEVKKEKKEAVVEAGIKMHEKEAKQQKHTVKAPKIQKTKIQRNIPKQSN